MLYSSGRTALNPLRVSCKTVAVIAIINAIIIFALHAVAGHVKSNNWGSLAPTAFVIADFLTLTVSCYILLILKNILTKRYDFAQANSFIYFVILFNALIFIVGQLLPSPPPPVLVCIIILYGLATTMLAYKIYHCPGDLKGLKNYYAAITAVSGLCIASFVFLPIGILASCLSDIVLGTIFYKLG